MSSDRQRAGTTRSLLALGHAAGGMAHDFNNALTAIAARAAIIKASSSDPDARHHAASILSATAAAGDVIDRVRIILRGDDTVQVVAVDPVDIVHEAAELARARGAERSIQIAVSAQPAPAIGAVPGDLLQLVANLAANAVDASPDGGVVNISCAPTDGGVLFVVADRGPGLHPDVLARLFEPFVSTKGANGTGLGLTLCRRIADRFGGDLVLAPRPGGGTIGRAIFPAAASDVPAPREPTGVELGAARPGAVILVVDDDRATRDALGALLGAGGFVVKTAANTEEALHVVRHWRPEVTVLDIDIGGESGWELARRIHAVDCAMPLIVATGGVVDVPEYAVSKVLSKPVNPGTVLRVVGELSQQRRRLSQLRKERKGAGDG